MVILNHELKMGRKMLIIWTLSIGFMVVLCILLYPQMSDQVSQVEDVYSNMGGFTEAFGMDKVSIATPMGFYGIECGNVLSIGCSFFVALLGANMLSKEEHSHTAEFLLTHPISRYRVIFEKLLAVVMQIIILNVVCMILGILSFYIIDEHILWKEFMLFHVAQFFMQMEIAFICFGISSFLKRSSVGIGIGIAVLMYFFNIISNISDKAEFLKYITPLRYADATQIISSGSIEGNLVLLGMLYAGIGVITAFLYYSKKDISV